MQINSFICEQESIAGYGELARAIGFSYFLFDLAGGQGSGHRFSPAGKHVGLEPMSILENSWKKSRFLNLNGPNAE